MPRQECPDCNSIVIGAHFASCPRERGARAVDALAPVQSTAEMEAELHEVLRWQAFGHDDED